MKALYLTPLFLVLSWTINPVISQEIICKIDLFGVNEGLSNRDVQAVQQDNEGFIWLGTKDGLNKFDGRDFKWFSRQENGLQSNEVNYILKDINNMLWLFNTDYKNNQIPVSVDIFNPLTEKAVPFEDFFKDAPFSLRDVVSFNAGINGSILFFTRDGRLISYKEKFTVKKLERFQFSWIFKIWQSPKGDIWINYYEKNKKDLQRDYDLIAFDSSGKKMWNYGKPDNVKYIEIIDFKEDGTCRFMLSAYDGSFEIFNVTPDFKTSLNTELRDHFLQVDPGLGKYNEICVQYMSSDGIWLINTDKFHIMDSHSSWYHSIYDKSIDFNTTTEIFEDDNQRIWVATQFGVYKVDLKENYFKQVAKGQETYPNRIRGLIVNDEFLWGVVENKKQIFKSPLKNPENIEFIPTGNSSYQIINANPSEICFCSGGIWTCLKKDNPQELQVKKRGILNNTGSFWSYYKDKHGKFWITNDKGEIGYLFEDEFIKIQDLGEDENLFYIYQFYKDSKDRIWLVTEGGLFILDVDQNKIKERYWRNGKDQFHLPFDNCRHIYEDKDGSFWLATSGDGLVNWKPESGIVFQLTRKEGLSNNNLHGIYEDDHGNLWISTDYGLNRFNKETHSVHSYLEHDGISHNEFNRISHAKDNAGNLYFGGLNGITYFHPDDFIYERDVDNYSMVITDFHQFVKSEGKLIDKTTELKLSKQIVLDPLDPFFRLSFNLLSYEDQDKIEFAYKFDETDPDWNYQSENYIRISSLNYGSQTLRIKGQGPDGKWSDNELVIEVIRLKPFYLKSWFISLSILIFLIAGPAFYRIRTNQLKKRQLKLKEQIDIRTETIKKQNEQLNAQAQKLQALDKLKTNFFTNVAHELRTPLTILLGPLGSILKSHQLDERNTMLLQNARESGHNLLALINQIMDLSKLDSKQLELNEQAVNLWHVVIKVYTQFQEQALIQKQALKLHYVCNKEMYVQLDKIKFERVIYNYLSNAIKFTPEDGEISLSVFEKDGDIILSVKDSGIGIQEEDHALIFDRYFQSENKNSASDSGTGIGLAIVHEYAKLFKGKAWVESTPGKGSSFFFSFRKKEVRKEKITEEKRKSLQRTKYEETSDIAKRTPGGSLGKPSPSCDKPSLLIVEDNPNLRNYLTFVFGDKYRLTMARNGKEALEHLSTGIEIQLIITDIMMPVMDGFELIDRLKSDDRSRHIPVIVLTAKADVKNKLRALRVGVDDYLVKPFEEEELMVRVDNLLSHYNARVEYISEISEPDEGKTRLSLKDSEWLANLEKLAFEAMEKQILSVNWMAHQTHLSERQFRRRLMKSTGLSPQKYLNQLRLQAAREMLEKGKKETILEVAVSVGFKDASSFARSYKKYFGKPPSQHFISQ